MDRAPTRVEVDAPGPGAPATVVRVLGDLDSPAAPQLQRALADVLRPGAAVVVDLAGCPFLDSVGIGVLVYGWQTGTKIGADFRLRNVLPYPQRVLTMVGLDTLIPIG
jgi:anti-anti-sigma factor